MVDLICVGRPKYPNTITDILREDVRTLRRYFLHDSSFYYIDCFGVRLWSDTDTWSRSPLSIIKMPIEYKIRIIEGSRMSANVLFLDLHPSFTCLEKRPLNCIKGAMMCLVLSLFRDFFLSNIRPKILLDNSLNLKRNLGWFSYDILMRYHSARKSNRAGMSALPDVTITTVTLR